MIVRKDVVGDARIASDQQSRRRAAPLLIGAAAMCVALFGGASSAWAGVGFSIVPTVPQHVAVGDKAVQSLLVITNASTDGPGESGYDTDDMRVDTISVVPSCGSTTVGSDCPAGSLDPGVLVPNPLSGVGAAGSVCAGRAFNFVLADAPMGKYAVAITGAPLVLGASSAGVAVRQCIITYTADVLKLPTIDAVPGVAPGQIGLQTGQKGGVTGTDIGPTAVNVNKTGGGVGTAGTTVLASPAITTNASANVVLGAGNLSDQATISGLTQPETGTGAGTVTFRLFGPGDTTCATAIYTSPVQPMTLNNTQTGGTAQSPTYTPTAAGVYHWQAVYSGDAYNSPVTGLCNEASEVTTVTPPAVTPPKAGVLSEVCTTPPGPAPAGGKLCARGTAAIAGHTGCQGTPFRVTVTGRQIQRVVFTLDGKIVRRLSKPNSGSRYVLQVKPSTLRHGVHRIIARATFLKQSGTKAKTMRVSFSRCARRANAPAFTG